MRVATTCNRRSREAGRALRRAARLAGLILVSWVPAGGIGAYEWCPQVSALQVRGKELSARFDAASQIYLSELFLDDLVTSTGVIVAGDDVLTIERAVVWDDQESNPSWLPFGWVPKVGDEFGSGNKWANWHLDVYSPDKRRLLYRTYLQGPARSPGGNCEWADEKDFKPQVLDYESYGIWDWDWVADGIQYDTVLVCLWEGDRGFSDDQIGCFRVPRNRTEGESLSLSDENYSPNPDGHDVDLDFRTETLNLNALANALKRKDQVWKGETKEKKQPGYKQKW